MSQHTSEMNAGRFGRFARFRSAFCRTSAATTIGATLLTSLSSTQVLAQPAAAAAAPSTNPSAAAPPATTPAVPQTTSSGSSSPDPVVACVESYTEGQRLRNDGHLLEGRGEFWECSKAACPAALRKDCIAWSEEIRAQIPTVSFRVTLDGKIATDAKIYMDGRLMEKANEGRAVELNPGPHKARFEYGTLPPQEQDFVAAEGERYRIINAEFQSASVTTNEPLPTGDESLPTSPPAVMERPVPAITYISLGLGAVGAISAAAWGISATVTASDLEATCSPNCSQGKIDAVKQRALISDVSLGVGVVGFALAGITYFLRPEVPGSVELDAASVGNHGAIGLVRFHTD